MQMDAALISFKTEIYDDGVFLFSHEKWEIPQ